MSVAAQSERDSSAGGRLWSLWDMLELNAINFLDAIKQLSNIHSLISSATGLSDDPLLDSTREKSLSLLEGMMSPIYSCGAKSAWVAASRLKERLERNDPTLTFGDLGKRLGDIESRFSDHLIFVKMYVVADDRSYLMMNSASLLGQDVIDKFVSSSFDCEEAAKCLCLGRATASVFHSMRVLEIGIRALSKRLSIPDPIRAAERNWSIILKKIKEKLEELYPSSSRLTSAEGMYLESVYANLEAVRNPWRNSVMHVDEIYTLEEAEHIFNCSKALLKKMAQSFDENGVENGQKDLPNVQQGMPLLGTPG